jgi:hypothetical protein
MHGPNIIHKPQLRQTHRGVHQVQPTIAFLIVSRNSQGEEYRLTRVMSPQAYSLSIDDIFLLR